jgi:hypothetical protein
VPRSRLALTLAPLILGGCEYFGTTTVPASDPQHPWAAVALWYDGDHQEYGVGNQTLSTAYNNTAFDVVTTNPWDYFMALGAGIDGGGVAEVQMTSRVRARCAYGALNYRILEPWATQTVSQSGSPGDTVDNGLYVAKSFRGGDYLSELDFCSDGSYFVLLEFYVRAEDFGGNVAYYGRGRVRYWHLGN